MLSMTNLEDEQCNCTGCLFMVLSASSFYHVSDASVVVNEEFGKDNLVDKQNFLLVQYV